MKSAIKTNEHRLAKARAALLRCTKDERKLLFREMGDCLCLAVVKEVGANPSGALGALIGGAIGYVIGGGKKSLPGLAGKSAIEEAKK